MNLVYCDGIAAICRKALREFIEEETEHAISSVGQVKFDLHEKDGYMLSTTKTISVEDINGRKYKITVEEDHSDVEVYPVREDIPAEYWGKPVVKN